MQKIKSNGFFINPLQGHEMGSQNRNIAFYLQTTHWLALDQTTSNIHLDYFISYN